MKKLNTILAVSAAALMVGAMPVAVFANETNYIPQNFAEYTIVPLWGEKGDISPTLKFSNGKASCRVSVTGDSTINSMK